MKKMEETQPEFLKVRNHANLVRDTKSNAILNIDLNSLDKYKEDRAEKLKILRVVEENQSLKEELDQIKAMLQKLLG
jgi:hypothetical protein